jgi:hypothetical protein
LNFKKSQVIESLTPRPYVERWESSALYAGKRIGSKFIFRSFLAIVVLLTIFPILFLVGVPIRYYGFILLFFGLAICVTILVVIQIFKKKSR